MSRATRQEALIRSLIEALCLTLKAKLVGQPKQKPKMMAADGVLQVIESLALYCPLELKEREGKKVIKVLDWFHRNQGEEPDLQKIEVLVALAMGLGGRLAEVIKNGFKVGLVGEMNRRLQALYDTFDRQGKKLEHLDKGAEFCDAILAKEL